MKIPSIRDLDTYRHTDTQRRIQKQTDRYMNELTQGHKIMIELTQKRAISQPNRPTQDTQSGSKTEKYTKHNGLNRQKRQSYWDT